MLNTYSQSVRANTKDLPCVSCQLMNDLLEENLGEGSRKGWGRVGGKEGEGQEKGSVRQELISYDRTHC